ncbi:tetratricopeptide repeat-containing response regulator [Janthinobacterium fluminis]|uniref:Response regulator n=1 Tax=Janthinobacterium fluminis TaxID=2987524 RepID=A0ABT5K5X9_9BURK|nr:tetratricopeptide repeat-containing response regulator [Janthinobacterium fluminis]MDC8760411.1 response regulator [Janthinobacterium fluminis]
MNELKGLTALIVEPHPGMRASLHNMLNLCGLAKIDDAANSSQAIRQMGVKSFDLILCEYDLEGGQDGQQLLEDLRHHKLVQATTMFFMVTGEGSFGKVVSAVELAPTDYILKPFTADNLLERIYRALDKRNAFLPVHQCLELGDERGAIAACLDGAAGEPRYATDFQRLRAELHVLLGEPAEAEPIYAALYAAKAIGWARLGQAKTLFLRGQYEEARVMLEALLENNKKFLDAYDWLARTYEALGQPAAAQAALGEAVALSPHALRRWRRLGQVALDAGDVDAAEKALKLVVSKARYSEFRDPEDHARLVRSLVRKGDPVQAAAVIRDLDKSMAGQKNSQLCSAVASAMLHEYTGNEQRLGEALDVALFACRHSVGVSSGLKIELARNCLDNGREEGAADVMRAVMRNAGSSAEMARAMAVFENAGRADLAVALAHESRQEVADLVAAGAAKAQQGDFRAAVDLMVEAAVKLPDNPQVVFNAAVAVLKCLEHNGWDERLGQHALDYIGAVRRLDPLNAKLPALSGLHQKILQKYNIRAGRWRDAGAGAAV